MASANQFASITTLVDQIVDNQEGYARGPERALMSALLFDGLQAYLGFVSGSASSNDRRGKEAHCWVHSNQNEYVFSFENVCDGLGIDPEYLRVGLSNAANSNNQEWKRQRRVF